MAAGRLSAVLPVFLLGFLAGISWRSSRASCSCVLRGGLGNLRASSSLGSIFPERELKEAPFVNGHRVLQVASNAFQLLDLSLEGLLFGLPGLGLGLQDLCLRLKGIPLAS